MGRVSDAREKLMEAVLELIHTGSYGSTTIDHICEKAGVKKGSFYYFFDSKSDLAIAAVEAKFQEERKLSDAIFSPTIPPLERIQGMCQYLLERQTELRRKHGRVLGCPLHSIGSEVSTEEPKLCAKIQNDLSVLIEMEEGTMSLLGLKETASA